jgi:hypothetical protein
VVDDDCDAARVLRVEDGSGMMTETAERLFMLFPDGRIEEVADEGEGRDYDPDASLYEDLVKAGYPPSYHGDFSIFDSIIDLRVVGDQVTVFTPWPTPREQDMGAAGELFLAWLRKADE